MRMTSVNMIWSDASVTEPTNRDAFHISYTRTPPISCHIRNVAKTLTQTPTPSHNPRPTTHTHTHTNWALGFLVSTMPTLCRLLLCNCGPVRFKLHTRTGEQQLMQREKRADRTMDLFNAPDFGRCDTKRIKWQFSGTQQLLLSCLWDSFIISSSPERVLCDTSIRVKTWPEAERGALDRNDCWFY